MTLGDFLVRLVTAMDGLRIPYMVTGSFASSAHGRARATEDIDIVVDPTEQQIRSLVAEFPKDRYYLDEDVAVEALRDRSQFNIIDGESAWKADLIVRRDREFSRVEFSRRKSHRVGSLDVHIATAEDVLISKLEWARLGGSGRQIEDAVGIIQSQDTKLDVAYIERWVRELALEDEWRRALERSI